MTSSESAANSYPVPRIDPRGPFGAARRFTKSAIAVGLNASGLDRVLGDDPGREALVLCYHRTVEDVRDHPLSLPAMLVTPRTLELQLECVGRRYDYVDLDELGRLLESGSKPRRPVAAVTFDDGYADVYQVGYPLLARKGIPAAIFVPTEFVERPTIHVHDRLFLVLERALSRLGPERLGKRLLELGVVPETVRRLDGAHTIWQLVDVSHTLLETNPRAEIVRLADLLDDGGTLPAELRESLAPMSWPMIREMHAAGIVVGSHTDTHIVLPNEAEPQIVAELSRSKRLLEQRLGSPVQHIAYPDGQFDPWSIACVHAAGYRYGYTTCIHRSPDLPLLTIPRRTFWERSSSGVGGFSAAVTACQARGVFEWLRPCRRDHGLRPAAAPVRERVLQGVAS